MAHTFIHRLSRMNSCTIRILLHKYCSCLNDELESGSSKQSKSHAIPQRHGGQLNGTNGQWKIPKVTYSLLIDSLVSCLNLKDFIF